MMDNMYIVQHLYNCTKSTSDTQTCVTLTRHLSMSRRTSVTSCFSSLLASRASRECLCTDGRTRAGWPSLTRLVILSPDRRSTRLSTAMLDGAQASTWNMTTDTCITAVSISLATLVSPEAILPNVAKHEMLWLLLSIHSIATLTKGYISCVATSSC